MQFLRQSTATAVLVGQFVDDVDGKTPETSLTVTSIAVSLVKMSNTHPLTKSDLTITASGGSNDMSHVARGYYSLELTTTDTNTAGRMRLFASISGALDVEENFEVLSQASYDALVLATAAWDANVTKWLGTAAVAGVGGRPSVDATAISGSVTAADNVEANIPNLDAASSGLNTKLVDVQARIPAALTAGGFLKASVEAIIDNATRATNLRDNIPNLDALISSRLAPTVAGRTLDVTAAGEAGIDFGNIGNPTTTVNLSGTTIGNLTANADKTGYGLSANESIILRTGTAQAGAAGTITLDSGANANNNFYNGAQIKIVSGTGANQLRTISGYVGSTKVASIDRNWVTNPDNTSVFVVMYNTGYKQTSAIEIVAASVTADVGITQAGADKVWLSASRTLTAFSTALAVSIWDVLESSISTASSIGLKVKTNLDAAISTRSSLSSGNILTQVLAGLDTAIPGTPTTGSINDKIKPLTYTNANKVDAGIVDATSFHQNAADKVWATATRALTDKANFALSTSERNSIADALLKRDFDGLTGEASYSMLNAMRFLRNKWNVISGTLHVYKEDGTTDAWTAALTETPGANPVTGVTPS